MTGLFENIVNKYNYWVHDLADPRTKDWIGVSNPFVILSIVSAYLYFCKILGPRLMKDRKPFEMKNILLVYNLFQVLLSLYLVYRGTKHVFSKEYNLACEAIDYSNSPRAVEATASYWWYYFAKITELLDTVFFVLRKKNNQVSFLHVYHHTVMSAGVWIGVKYFPGGHLYFMGYLNSIVHVIMYTYYLISGLGPQYQKYVWWKKHVTAIQLIQFCIILVHNVNVFFYDCNYPRVLNLIGIVNAIAFINMFGKFYFQSYNKNTRSKTKLEAKPTVITRKLNKHNAMRNSKEKVR